MTDQQAPDWLDRVFYATDCGTTDMLGKLADQPLNTPLPPPPDRSFLADTLGPRNDRYVYFSLFAPSPIGSIPTEGTWIANVNGRRVAMDPARLRWCLQKVRGGDKRIKLALYDWNRSVWPTEPPFNAHPEWLAQTADGKTLKSFFHGVVPESAWLTRSSAPATGGTPRPISKRTC